MTREELVEQIKALAKKAMENDDTTPAASVLLSLAGAMCAGNDADLMVITSRFSEAFLIQQKARR